MLSNPVICGNQATEREGARESEREGDEQNKRIGCECLSITQMKGEQEDVVMLPVTSNNMNERHRRREEGRESGERRSDASYCKGYKHNRFVKV